MANASKDVESDGKKKGSLNRVFVTTYLSRVLERIRKFKSRPSQDDLQEIVSAASLHASKVDPTAKYGPHRADITPDKVDRKLRSLMKRHKRIQKKMTDKKLTSDQLGGKEKHSFDCGNLVLLIEKELKMNKGEAKGKGTTEKKAEGRKEQAADEMEASDHEDSREESVDLEKEAAQEGVEGVEEENEEHEGGEREDVEQEHSEHEDAEQENGEHEDAEQEKGEEEDVQEKESEQEGLQEKESEQEDLQEKESEEKDVQQKESEKEDAETESDEENAEQEAPKKKYQLRKTHDVKSLKAKNEEDAKAAPLTPGKKARLVGNVPVVTTPGSGRGRRLNTTLITSAFQSQLNFVKEFDRLPNETELSEILHKAYHFALESDPEGKHGTHRESPPDIKSFVAKRRSILKAFKTMKNQQMAGRGISNRKDLTKSELSTIECANIINEIDALSKSRRGKRRGLDTKPLPVAKKSKRNVAVKPAIVELEDVPSSKTLNGETNNEDLCIAILDEQKRMMQLMLEAQQRIELQQQQFYTSFLQTVKTLLPTHK